MINAKINIISHSISKLTKQCFYNHNSEIHSCFHLGNNSTNYSYDNINTDQSDIQSWVNGGPFHNIHNISENNTQVIAHFSKCSQLPIVQTNFLGISKVAIIDTGAVRSLISSHAAHQIFGEGYKNMLTSVNNTCLKDVNQRIIPIQGSLNTDFYLGSHKYNFNFIIYESTASEILLGFDFLKSFDLGIFPNLGLVPVQTSISQVLYENKPDIELVLCDNLTLQPGAQTITQVRLKDTNMSTAACLLQRPVLVHSQFLQPETPWEFLTVIFQYVTIQADLTANILIINHSDTLINIEKDTLIAHLEFVEQIATAQQVENDHFASVFLSHMEAMEASIKSESINFPEDKICIDLPEDHDFDPVDINCHSSDPRIINWLRALHEKYKSIFSNREYNPGLNPGSSIHFSVKTNATIIHQKYQKINPAIYERAQAIIDTLLSRNLIEISDSPWASRVIFVEKQVDEQQNKDGGQFIPGEKVKKKQGKLRLVVDLRAVNQRLRNVTTNWVVPSVWSILQDFQGAKYISCIDINSGFWSFRLSERAKRLTAFRFGDLTFQLTRLVQGLKCSSAFMQIKMRKIILKYNLQGCIIFIDNILIYADDFETYQQRLAAVFEACFKENIRIKQNKSHHCITDTFVLFGFTISLKNGTISPEQDKVQKLLDMEIPDSKRRVRAFVGGTAYFQNLVENFQKIIAPLHHLAAPKTQFIWDEKCQAAFQEIKTILAKLPFLYLYNPSKIIHFYCDAAMTSYLAYCLYQVSDANGEKYPIKYNSHKLTENEAKF